MKPKMRCNLSGKFLSRDLGQGVWRLSRNELAPVDVWLRGAHSVADDALRPPSVSDIEVEWQEETALLKLTSAQRRICLEARSVIVHEPLGTLYEVLPLAGFDSKAKRFWGRVFRLVRIPGGRHLLRILARRRRGGH